MQNIPIHIAVEDVLSEAVVRKLLINPSSTVGVRKSRF